MVLPKEAKLNYAKGIEPLSALESRSAEILKTARETGCPVLLTRAAVTGLDLITD